MTAPEIATWAAGHSVNEIRQQLASMQLTPTPRMVEMLGAFPEYLDPVVDFLMTQRQKLIQGKVTARDVAKAYFITLSSIGSDAVGVDTIRERADEIGLAFNPDPMFLSKGAKGQDVMRPEELAAWWFSTLMGQRALNAIEKGTVDLEAWEQGLAIRDAFGRNDARERTSSTGAYAPGMVGERRKSATSTTFSRSPRRSMQLKETARNCRMCSTPSRESATARRGSSATCWAWAMSPRLTRLRSMSGSPAPGTHHVCQLSSRKGSAGKGRGHPGRRLL